MSTRGVVAVLAVVALVVAGFSTSSAQAQAQAQAQVASAPLPGPQIISNTITGFPSGGEPLKQAISDLIYQNPDFAADVANYLQTEGAGLSEAQKAAIEAGLADGLNRLGVVGFIPVAGISPLLLGAGGAAAAGGAGALALANKKSCTPVSPNTTC
jgi:hypothetical protein